MPRRHHNDLVPKNGRALQVIVVARISDPDNQDEKSNEDQTAYAVEYLKHLTKLPCQFKVLAGSGSGEYLDRKEFLELGELIESGDYDLVISEDLGRICRRWQAMTVCEECEDHNSRLIAINDNLDTS